MTETQSILWQASEERKLASQMNKYCEFLAKNYGRHFSKYSELHQWSVSNREDFWKSQLEFFKPVYTGDINTVLGSNKDFIPHSWFPKLQLNFAENLLVKGEGASTAITFCHESGLRKKITYSELRRMTAKVQEFLEPHISEGDVVAAYMPNVPATIVGMLGATSIGGIFTSTSCDFGIQGVLDRFGQTKPKVLIAAVEYTYNGKKISQVENIKEIQKSLPSLEKVILVDFLGSSDVAPWEGTVLWKEILATQSRTEPKFTPRAFSDPLYIMYSSGTTGKPKCIVHSVGGTLVQHLKELGLHTDLTSEKTLFYFTTCGWMMWNWLVSGLAFGANIMLYEGSPAAPSLEDFLKILKEEKVHIWGTSPKFLRAIEGISNLGMDYPELETILSTGAPLLPEQYDFVYHKIKKDILLASISGGTDIIGCFMLGNPWLPVNRGEIQGAGLGMDIAAFNSEAKAVIDEEGELVCRQSFPSCPIGFWNDQNHEKFKSAYFETYQGVWHHGDFVRIAENGSVRVYGRSDATLNPGGVRIGTAEIYRQTEKLSYVEDSLCVGRKTEDDVDVVLFIKLKSEGTLTNDQINEIKAIIKEHNSPRHVPREVYQVNGIPYTRSGKKMELAITRLINGRPITNKEAVANPECLAQYENFINMPGN